MSAAAPGAWEGACSIVAVRPRMLFILPLDVPWQGPYVIEKAAT